MVADRADLTGLRFFKMTGSGNDFVFLDGREGRAQRLETPDVIRRLCARGTGIGADGVVWLIPGESGVAYRMRYRNSDGSLASMCGNAALCSVALSVRLGFHGSSGAGSQWFNFDTDAGRLRGRIRADGMPEVELGAVRGVRRELPIAQDSGESRIGFANSGVPHLVVLCGNAETADIAARGRALRFAPELAPEGANVNFVSPLGPDRWRMRTYERGVEGETLACGTGAAAIAVLLANWGLGDGKDYRLETTSGHPLLVSLHEDEGITTAALAGEGRLVFEGEVVNT